MFSFSGTYLEVEQPVRTVETWHFNCSPDVEAVEDGWSCTNVTQSRRSPGGLAFRDKAGRDHMTGFDGQLDSLDEMEDILRSLLASRA